MAQRGASGRSGQRDSGDGWQTATNGGGHGRGGRGGRGGARGKHPHGSPSTGAAGGRDKNWRENSNSRLPSRLLEQAQSPQAHAEGGEASEGSAAAAAGAAPVENQPPRLGVVRCNEEGTIRIVNTFDVFRDPGSALKKGDIVDLNTRAKVDLPFETEGWDSAGCIALSMEAPGVWSVFLMQSKCTEDFLAWYYPVLKKVDPLPILTEEDVRKWALEEVRAVAEWSFPMFAPIQGENMNAIPEEAKDGYKATARAVYDKVESDEALAAALEKNADNRFWDYVGGRVRKCRCLRSPHDSNAHCTALAHFDKEMEPFPEGACEMLDAFTFDIHDHGILNVKKFSLFCIPLDVRPGDQDKVKLTAGHDFHHKSWFSLNDLADGKETVQFRPRESLSLADSRRFFAELRTHVEALHGRFVGGLTAEEEEVDKGGESGGEEEEEEEDDILERMMSLGKPKASAGEGDKRN